MFAKVVSTAAVAATIITGLAVPAQAHSRRHHVRHYQERADYAPRNCHSNGTTGLIVGGVAGGVAGNRIAGEDHRTVGTLVGAGAGGLLGRAIDRHHSRC